MGYAARREFGVRGPRRRWSWYGRSRVPSGAVGAAGRAGPGDGGLRAARQLSTVKTHMRNLYAKLDGHSRAETVERARALGLLAPSAHL